MSRLVSRTIAAPRGRTSMRLEPEFWDALDEICRRENITPGVLIRLIEQRRDHGSRTSAVRVFILLYFRAAATEAGHRAARHGSGLL